jgi:hypothetical protein
MSHAAISVNEVDRDGARELGHCKGGAFRELVRYYTGRYGSSQLATAVLSMPEAFRSELDPSSPTLGIVTSAWYDARTVHSLLDALTNGLTLTERRELAMDASTAVMKSTLHGVYRLLFRLMATPERYARHAPKLFSAYYDRGRIEVINGQPTCAVITTFDWTTHHPFICLLNWGAAKTIYSEMGCRNVRVERTHCVDGGATSCRFIVTWDA